MTTTTTTTSGPEVPAFPSPRSYAAELLAIAALFARREAEAEAEAAEAAEVGGARLATPGAHHVEAARLFVYEMAALDPECTCMVGAEEADLLPSDDEIRAQAAGDGAVYQALRDAVRQAFTAGIGGTFFRR